MRITLALISTTALLAAVAATAHPGPGPDKRILELFDANGDGQITQVEFDELRKRRIREHFKKLDEDGDGKITLAEFEKARLARGARHFARMDRDGDGVIEPGELHHLARIGHGPRWAGCDGAAHRPGKPAENDEG